MLIKKKRLIIKISWKYILIKIDMLFQNFFGHIWALCASKPSLHKDNKKKQIGSLQLWLFREKNTRFNWNAWYLFNGEKYMRKFVILFCSISKGTFNNEVPRFLAIFDLPTYLVLLYNVHFLGLSWTPLPSLIWDVINERSLTNITEI